MKNVDVEIKSILGKVYNFRSSESALLIKIDNEKNTLENTKKRTSEEKELLTKTISDFEHEEKLLNEDGKKLTEVLEQVNKNNYIQIFGKINVNFDPGKLFNDVKKGLPETLGKIKQEKEDASSRLKDVTKELNDSITMIEELAIRKDEAIANQNKLNEYFDLSLKGSISITRDTLIKLLAKFELNDDEQREVAKLLMFPEDGLFQFEKEYNEAKKTGKSFSEVFAEAKEVEEELEVIELTPPEEIKKELEVIELNPELTEETFAPVIEEITEEEKEEPVQNEVLDIKKILGSLGFNIKVFSSDDIAFIEQNYNEEIMNNNLKIVKELGINNDIFIENIELFIDDELKTKIDILLEVGKVPFDIYLNPSILVKYEASELKDAINNLKESGLDPKKVPLMAY